MREINIFSKVLAECPAPAEVAEHGARAAFSKESAESLDAQLRAMMAIYVANKGIFTPEHKAARPPFTFISTPHPIGNLTIEQGLLLNLIYQMLQLSWRRERSDKYNDEYCRDTVAQYVKRTMALVQPVNPPAAKRLQDIPTTKGRTIEHVIEHVAKVILAEGISHDVISRPVQYSAMLVKERNMGGPYAQVPHNVASWGGVDGDGDKFNSMSERLPDEVKGKTLFYIYTLCKGVPELRETMIEPRISCFNKKGVVGVAQQLAVIGSVRDIQNWDDMFDQERFERAYQHFKTFLGEVKYNPEESYEDTGPKQLINSPLDLILRVCAPLFTRSQGLVLSDYGPDIMPQLRFIQQGVVRYLQERTGDTSINLSHAILPLCENYNSIIEAPKEFAKFLNAIERQIRSAKDNTEQLLRIKRLLCPDNENLFYGIFSGPSDLTKVVGSQSLHLIEQSRVSIRTQWYKFVHEVWRPNTDRLPNKELSLDNVEPYFQFGKGTSPRRGGNLVLCGSPTTFQGHPPAISVLSYIQAYARYGSAEDKTLVRKMHDRLIPYRSLAIKFHQQLLGEGGPGGPGEPGEPLGKIIAEFNGVGDRPGLKDSRIFYATLPQFCNNQGSRSAAVPLDGPTPKIPQYHEQRAITCAAITTFFGLITAPGMPGPGDIQTIDKDYDLEKVLDHPVDLQILLADLFQIVCLDTTRAKTLGFSDEVINLSRGYAHGVLDLVGRKLGLAEDSLGLPDISSIDTDYSAPVVKIVDEVVRRYPNTLVAHVFTQFREQIPCITAQRDLLTKCVSAPCEMDDKHLANVASLVNGLANFQLPIVPDGMDQGKLIRPFVSIRDDAKDHPVQIVSCATEVVPEGDTCLLQKACKAPA